MNFENSPLFKILDYVTAFVQLNILWLICCIPVITIFPATVAMFCVIRQWILHKDTSIYRPFFQFFKENFKLSFLLGLIWTLFVGLFLIDFLLMKNFGQFQYILLPVLTFIGLVILFISVFIFPIIANYTVDWLKALKSSFFFSIRYILTTISAILLLGLSVLILITWPITFIFIFSLYAFCIYLLCDRIFRKVELLSN
jgi:uncharacterized membrane protein YesL